MQKPPQYVQPPPDAQYEQLKAQAQQQQDIQGQATARADTASLMARYGRLVSSGATMPGTLPFAGAPATSDQPPSAMPIATALQMVGSGGNAGPLLQQLFRG